MSRAIKYFPVVGAFIGIVVAAAAYVMGILGFNEFAINASAVVLMIIITGALHLDGLADTFDALASGKSKEEMLVIMRDPHIGTMGVVALISILLLKFSLLFSVGGQLKAAALVLMCTLSRWSMVVLMASFPYARKDGKAKLCIEGTNFMGVILATVITLIIAIALFGIKGLSICAFVAVTLYLFGKIVTQKIGGITGDTLGAASEIMEVAALFSICLYNTLWI